MIAYKVTRIASDGTFWSWWSNQVKYEPGVWIEATGPIFVFLDKEVARLTLRAISDLGIKP